MKTVVLVPRKNGRFLMGEECCWQRGSTWTPVLPVSLATALHEMGDEVTVVPVDLETLELPKADRYAMVFTWAFGDDLEPLLKATKAAGQCPTLIVPDPESTSVHLESFGVDSLPPRDVFVAEPNLKLVSWEVWSGCRRVMVQATTGCQWACPFCVWGRPRWRNNAGMVVGLVRELLERVPAAREDASGGSVFLLCNEVTGDRRWLMDLCQGMALLNVAWKTDANVRNLGSGDAKALAWAGCKSLTLGVEALEGDLLRRLGKGHTVETAFKAFESIQAAGIRYHFSLRQGVGETVAQVEEMGRNAERMFQLGLRPEWVRMAAMAEWPGQTWMTDLCGENVERLNVGSERYPRWRAQLSADVAAAWRGVAEVIKRFECLAWEPTAG